MVKVQIYLPAFCTFFIHLTMAADSEDLSFEAILENLQELDKSLNASSQSTTGISNETEAVADVDDLSSIALNNLLKSIKDSRDAKLNSKISFLDQMIKLLGNQEVPSESLFNRKSKSSLGDEVS